MFKIFKHNSIVKERLKLAERIIKDLDPLHEIDCPALSSILLKCNCFATEIELNIEKFWKLKDHND